jgi:hypothetical protein
MKAMHEDDSALVRQECVKALPPLNSSTIKNVCLKTQDPDTQVREVSYQLLEKHAA